MKPHFAIVLVLWPLATFAHKISVKQLRQTQTIHPRISTDDFQVNVADGGSVKDGLDLNTVRDLVYMANITVAGVDYSVQLDTGSSDLWVTGATHPLPNTMQTSIAYNLTYLIGWAYGHIAYAPVEFVGLSVPSQAFLDVQDVKNPALSYGAQGVVGLGFTSLSIIDLLVNRTDGSTGRSLLYQLFSVHPDQPNFLTFALQRSTEADDEVEGIFSIGEFEPKYASVSGNERIPTWPVHSPKRWSVLLDALIINSTTTVPTTKAVGAPSNKAVVLIDSGSSFTYAPKEICDAIYANIPGAHFDNSITQWAVPCNYEIDLALQIGGQVFPMHPLDITPSVPGDSTTCYGSFIPEDVATVSGKEFDWLIGDNFLRSVYSVYDFGDFDSSGQMGDPYMKFLSIIDPDEASEDFHKIRGGTPKTNITYTGLDGTSIAPSFFISNDISDSLEKIGKYLPAMLAIVALNALVLIVLIIVGLFTYCRKRRTAAPFNSARARTPLGRLSSMPMNPRNTYIPGLDSTPQSHTYQPVSMALTEDTFVPPSPAFHHLEGSKVAPGDRPKSIA